MPVSPESPASPLSPDGLANHSSGTSNSGSAGSVSTADPGAFDSDDLQEFDPLAEDELDEDDESTEFIGMIERPSDTAIAVSEPETQLAPEERIADLIKKMPGRRKVLLGIVAFCREPQRPAAVDAFTDDLQRNNYSVYTPVVLRQLLEEAGALVYVELGSASPDAHGAPDAPGAQSAAGTLGATDATGATDTTAAAGDAAAAPDSVDADGYLVVTKRPEGAWVATAAGVSVLDSLNPQQDLLDLLERDSAYLEIYKRILAYCTEEPRSKKQLDDLVDDDPLVQKPRRYSGYFVDKLEACDALEWAQHWSTTDIGKAVL